MVKLIFKYFLFMLNSKFSLIYIRLEGPKCSRICFLIFEKCSLLFYIFFIFLFN